MRGRDCHPILPLGLGSWVISPSLLPESNQGVLQLWLHSATKLQSQVSKAVTTVQVSKSKRPTSAQGCSSSAVAWKQATAPRLLRRSLMPHSLWCAMSPPMMAKCTICAPWQAMVALLSTPCARSKGRGLVPLSLFALFLKNIAL